SPKLAEDPRSQHRYSAACVAALAADGQGRDADKLDQKERECLRSQAYDWLRAELAAWARLFNDTPQVRVILRQALAHWLKAPDLASVREPTALAKLPPDDEAAWCRLWDDVEALLRQTGEPKPNAPGAE